MQTNRQLLEKQLKINLIKLQNLLLIETRVRGAETWTSTMIINEDAQSHLDLKKKTWMHPKTNTSSTFHK